MFDRGEKNIVHSKNRKRFLSVVQKRDQMSWDFIKIVHKSSMGEANNSQITAEAQEEF